MSRNATSNATSIVALLSVACLLGAAATMRAQAPVSGTENAPASLPAGVLPPAPTAQAAAIQPRISSNQAREADDAYLYGAKQVQRKDLAAAERSFERAVQLNPGNRDYALALIVVREDRLAELVQLAAKARRKGDDAGAEALLAEARKLDPESRVITQHLEGKQTASGLPEAALPHDPNRPAASDLAATLGGPIELEPAPGLHDFHLRGDAQTLIRNVYRDFGIATTFDSSVSSGSAVEFNLSQVDFAAATSALEQLTHTFIVPVQPKLALAVRDSVSNRDQFMPQVEETVYLPGVSADQMTELANVARNIFDLKQVTASATGGDMLLRGDERVLRQLNATFADMLDGGSDVLFDVTLYEIDQTHDRNIGATTPSSAGVFSIAAEAQSLISTNQSLLNQAIAAGLLTLTGTPLQNELKEIEFLVGSGAIKATQYTNLLGTFGGGLSYAGLFLGSSSTFNLLLNSTDVRTLDAVTIRAGNRQATSFRAGTRYPVVTATYSSGVSSSLASSLAGLNINGTSVSSLLSQYLGSGSVSVPQFQFEDLGITLKLTPTLLHDGEVQLALDMKIEALAGGTIDSIPILNSRALTSTITVPTGQTAMLASLVTKNEVRSIEGLPGLSELPGFQGTDQNVEKDSQELLLTITPHVVRPGALHVASRRLAAVRTAPGSASP
jgi:tetratricopeptide (TPR) repeat protein